MLAWHFGVNCRNGNVIGRCKILSRTRWKGQNKKLFEHAAVFPQTPAREKDSCPSRCDQSVAGRLWGKIQSARPNHQRRTDRRSDQGHAAHGPRSLRGRTGDTNYQWQGGNTFKQPGVTVCMT